MSSRSSSPTRSDIDSDEESIPSVLPSPSDVQPAGIYASSHTAGHDHSPSLSQSDRPSFSAPTQSQDQSASSSFGARRSDEDLFGSVTDQFSRLSTGSAAQGNQPFQPDQTQPSRSKSSTFQFSSFPSLPLDRTAPSQQSPAFGGTAAPFPTSNNTNATAFSGPQSSQGFGFGFKQTQQIPPVAPAIPDHRPGGFSFGLSSQSQPQGPMPLTGFSFSSSNTVGFGGTTQPSQPSTAQASGGFSFGSLAPTSHQTQPTSTGFGGFASVAPTTQHSQSASTTGFGGFGVQSGFGGFGSSIQQAPMLSTVPTTYGITQFGGFGLQQPMNRQVGHTEVTKLSSTERENLKRICREVQMPIRENNGGGAYNTNQSHQVLNFHSMNHFDVLKPYSLEELRFLEYEGKQFEATVVLGTNFFQPFGFIQRILEQSIVPDVLLRVKDQEWKLNGFMIRRSPALAERLAKAQSTAHTDDGLVVLDATDLLQDQEVADCIVRMLYAPQAYWTMDSLLSQHHKEDSNKDASHKADKIRTFTRVIKTATALGIEKLALHYAYNSIEEKDSLEEWVIAAYELQARGLMHKTAWNFLNALPEEDDRLVYLAEKHPQIFAKLLRKSVQPMTRDNLYREENTFATDERLQAQEAASIMQYMRRLFANRDDDPSADATLQSGDFQTKVHKAILASRSEMFRGMFSGNYKDSVSTIIDLQELIGISDPQTMEAFVRFAYTDHLSEQPIPPQVLLNLIRIADAVAFDQLEEAAGDALKKYSSNEVVNAVRRFIKQD